MYAVVLIVLFTLAAFIAVLAAVFVLRRLAPLLRRAARALPPLVAFLWESTAPLMFVVAALMLAGTVVSLYMAVSILAA